MSPVALIFAGCIVVFCLASRAGLERLLAVALAGAYGPLTGLTISSLAYFFAATFDLPRSSWIFIAAGLVVALLVSQPKTPVRGLSRRRPIRSFRTLSSAAAYLSLLASSSILIRAHVLAIARSWEGQWDATAIWNQRAAFLFSGYESLPGALARIDSYFHADYPLLLPAALAAVFTAGGGPSGASTSVVHFGIVLGCGATVYLLLRSLDERAQLPLAALGTAVLLCTPTFLEASLQETADVLTASAVLATVAGLGSILSSSRDWSVPAPLIGVAFSSLLFVKNEGLIYAGLIAIVFVGVSWSSKTTATLGRILLTTVPGLLSLLLFRTLWVSNDEAGRFAAGAKHVFRFERWSLPAKELFARITPTAGPGWDWRVVWSFLVISLVASLLLRRAHLDRERLFGLLALTALPPTWIAAYALSPYDQHWHIATSMSRIMVHAFPLAIVVTFACLSVALVNADNEAPFGNP